jgi:RHS repeat-associated protein
VPRALTGGGRKSTQDLASLPVVLQEGRSTYVWGLDLISATDKDGNQTYFLYDGLGSTTGLADDEGNVTAGYGYDVFGATRSQSGTADTMFRFTGEQRDSDSGLYYLRARYYDPATGRLVTKDPIPGGNPYAYAGNDPVRYVDPGGLCIPGYNCPPGQGGGIFPPFLPISKEGGHFGGLCPKYDPTHIYVIIDGVCYDATSPACPAGVNPLLCDGEKGLFGFRPEKALGDAFQWFSDNPEITSGIAASLGCVVFAGPTIFTAAGPGVTGGAAVVVVCGGAGAIAASTGVNPLSP